MAGTMRRHKPSITALMALVLVTVTLVPALSASMSTTCHECEGNDDLLAKGGGEGAGWASYEVESDGSEIVLNIRAEGLILPIQVGQIAYEEDGEPVFGKVFSMWSVNDGYKVHLLNGTEHEVNVSGFDETEEGEPGGSVDTSIFIRGGDRSFEWDAPGELTIVQYIAGYAEHWTHRLEGVEGNELLANATGDEAFIYESRHFDGVASVETPQRGTRAQVMAQKALDVDHRIIGSFSSPGLLAGVNEMSMDAPQGEQDCSCYPWSGLDVHRTGGTYTFHLTGAGATLEGEVFLAGADVQLPSEVSQE